jgi:hypothetical protein
MFMFVKIRLIVIFKRISLIFFVDIRELSCYLVAMPKRKCIFNDQLQKEFEYIKRGRTEHDVTCTHCGSSFSIAHGGRSDINDHLLSEKHKRAIVGKSSKGNLTNFFPHQSATSEDLQRAAAEGLLAYHTLKHGHSFRSMDCTSKLIKHLYDKKFSSARTKTEAIVTDCIAPFALEEIAKDLDATPYISLSTDASNHHATKLIPVVIQYFVPSKGIQVKLLDVHEVPGETAEIVTSAIMDTVDKFSVKPKVVAFSADNTNANFGGAHRQGRKNIYANLKTALGRSELLGIGCSAHILHNAMQTAADCLPFDVEQIVCKIYQHFSIYTVRVEKLKDFCEFAGVEYKKLLGYSKTRWLALMPAVERILLIYDGLKSYFSSLPHCPTVIQAFFEDPLSETWMYFVHCQSSHFNRSVTKIQSQLNTAMEINQEVSNLKASLQARKNEAFLGIETKRKLNKLEKDGDVTKQQVNHFVDKATLFYATCIEYIERWDHSDDVSKLSFALLTKTPTWSEVEVANDMVCIVAGRSSAADDNRLFDQTTCVASYATAEMIERWAQSGTSTGQRWLEVFEHFKNQQLEFDAILRLVQFALALPGTNAPIERVFSLMNDMWTDAKTQLTTETLKSMLITTVNISSPCLDFHELIKSNNRLLKSIHGSQKYKWKRSEQTGAVATCTSSCE